MTPGENYTVLFVGITKMPLFAASVRNGVRNVNSLMPEIAIVGLENLVFPDVSYNLCD